MQLPKYGSSTRGKRRGQVLSKKTNNFLGQKSRKREYVRLIKSLIRHSRCCIQKRVLYKALYRWQTSIALPYSHQDAVNRIENLDSVVRFIINIII